MQENITNEKLIGKWGKINYFFNIYKNKKFSKGTNLISLSFFMLKEVDELYAYQRRKTSKEEFAQQHKEKVKKYLSGIDNIIDKVKNQEIDYTIRIYCDITTIKYLQKYLTQTNIELYMYFFPQFFVNDHHIGFFGTLMRYLPLFKLENHNEREWTTTTVMDLDIDFTNELAVMKYYLNRIKMGHIVPNLLFQTGSCYFTNTRQKYIKMYPSVFAIISSFFMQRDVQDFGIFRDFLEDLLKDKFYDYNRVLDLYLGDKKKGRLMKGRLEYGVDEYFINKIFLQKLYLDKNEPFFEVLVGNTMGYGLVQWLSDLRMENRKIENPQLLEQFLKVYVAFFMPDYEIQPYKNIKDMIEQIGEDSYRMKIMWKQLDVRKFDKLIEIIKKIKPYNLNMHKNMIVCMERSLKFPHNKVSIILVRPIGKYPRYEEKLVNVINIKSDYLKSRGYKSKNENKSNKG